MDTHTLERRGLPSAAAVDAEPHMPSQSSASRRLELIEQFSTFLRQKLYGSPGTSIDDGPVGPDAPPMLHRGETQRRAPREDRDSFDLEVFSKRFLAADLRDAIRPGPAAVEMSPDDRQIHRVPLMAPLNSPPSGTSRSVGERQVSASRELERPTQSGRQPPSRSPSPSDPSKKPPLRTPAKPPVYEQRLPFVVSHGHAAERGHVVRSPPQRATTPERDSPSLRQLQRERVGAALASEVARLERALSEKAKVCETLLLTVDDLKTECRTLSEHLTVAEREAARTTALYGQALKQIRLQSEEISLYELELQQVKRKLTKKSSGSSSTVQGTSAALIEELRSEIASLKAAAVGESSDATPHTRALNAQAVDVSLLTPTTMASNELGAAASEILQLSSLRKVLARDVEEVHDPTDGTGHTKGTGSVIDALLDSAVDATIIAPPHPDDRKVPSAATVASPHGMPRPLGDARLEIHESFAEDPNAKRSAGLLEQQSTQTPVTFLVTVGVAADLCDTATPTREGGVEMSRFENVFVSPMDPDSASDLERLRRELHRTQSRADEAMKQWAKWVDLCASAKSILAIERTARAKVEEDRDRLRESLNRLTRANGGAAANSSPRMFTEAEVREIQWLARDDGLSLATEVTELCVKLLGAVKEGRCRL